MITQKRERQMVASTIYSFSVNTFLLVRSSLHVCTHKIFDFFCLGFSVTNFDLSKNWKHEPMYGTVKRSLVFEL